MPLTSAGSLYEVLNFLEDLKAKAGSVLAEVEFGNYPDKVNENDKDANSMMYRATLAKET